MDVNFEHILQHSNQNLNFVKSDLATLHSDQLNWKESAKKWSVIEVIGHLNKVFDLYLPNFEKAVNAAPDQAEGGAKPLQRTFMGRISIYTQKPKGQKRKFKMKTFDFFQPVHDPTKTNEVINTFVENKDRFNELIKKARLKDLKGIKMPTALGEKLKFYVPECFEFVLAHEDRHMVQIEGVLDLMTS
ncbi:MAG: DinB family protein [Bacteroidota bacterium]